jgi:hypothetical protein
MNPWLAQAVLGVHLVVIAFNVFGLIAVPLGGWLGWRWVRAPWWRWLHLVSMAVVAVQAVAGQACFLTIVQARLSGAGGAPEPLIMGVVNRLIFWPVPLWAFAVLYVLLLAYVLALMKLVPPGPLSARRSRDG